MIKFFSTTDREGALMGFGLSEANIEQLKKGHPIAINAGEISDGKYQELRVIIFYGETEEKMREDLSQFLGKDTIIIDRKKGVEN